MEMGLKGKPVLVMASSAGLGKAAAMEFAREGAKVMLFGRTEERLQQARADIEEATGNRPEYTVGDIARAADVNRVVEETAAAFGGIYALINNCGGPPAGTFDQFDDDAWQEAFEQTLFGFIRSIRAVLPLMKKAGAGRIANFTSYSIRQVIDNLVLSNTFRMGVVGLTKSLSQELAPQGILVNVIAPGKIDTERLRGLEAIRAQKTGLSLEELQKKSLSEIAVGRYGKPEEMARLAVFLCSQANTYITGQTVLVEGGLVRAY